MRYMMIVNAEDYLRSEDLIQENDLAQAYADLYKVPFPIMTYSGGYYI